MEKSLSSLSSNTAYQSTLNNSFLVQLEDTSESIALFHGNYRWFNECPVELAKFVTKEDQTKTKIKLTPFEPVLTVGGAPPGSLPCFDKSKSLNIIWPD